MINHYKREKKLPQTEFGVIILKNQIINIEGKISKNNFYVPM